MAGMEMEEHRIERIWDSRATALVLGAIGAGCAVWANIWLPLPGVSVAILGAMAAVMSLRPKMRMLEKAAWMVLISAMLGAEIHSIRRDRSTNDAKQSKIRDAENQKFDAIARGLKNAIELSKGQYSSTVSHVDSVLQTTQGVAATAQANLNDVPERAHIRVSCRITWR
jgi:hypothetical protein